jgi:hypothetical protein
VNDLPAGLWHAERVSFDRCPLFPGEIECLLKLGHEKLELDFTQLTDEDLKTIKPLLTRVVELKIGHSLVTDTALELLAENRNLTQLYVELTQVSSTALAEVLSNKSLRSMALDSRQLTLQVGQSLRRGPRVNLLVILCYADAPLQLAHLRDAEPNAIHLHGDRTTGVSPPCPDLTPLQTAANFTTLRMQCFTFTPEQLQQVAALRQLRTLHFARCDLDADAIRQLEVALPLCKITVRN